MNFPPYNEVADALLFYIYESGGAKYEIPATLLSG